MAAIAVLIAPAWRPPAHADGGSSSARIQTSVPAPDDSGATIQARAQRILRILSDRHANNWARYWQARDACDDAPTPAGPLDRILLTLTASLCARIDARLGVNPAAYSPRGENRAVGLLLNEPAAAAGYTLFHPQGGKHVYLIDPLGRVAHAWNFEKTPSGVRVRFPELLDNGNLMAVKDTSRMSTTLLEVDKRGNIVWQYQYRGLHHDFLEMPNGNILLLARSRKTREQTIAAGANPDFVHEDGIEYDYLAEVRPTDANGGEIVWRWSPWDHLVQDFDPTKPNYGAIAEHPELIDINFLLQTISERRQYRPNDWLHSNAIDYNPELDQIMLSARHFSEIWIIDRSATTQEARGHSGGNSGMGGDLLYRWGNPRAYGHGDGDDQRLFWQHQTHWIPPGLPGAGNILVFNNGHEFRGYRRSYSSIDEIAPPVDGYRYRRADNAAYPPDELAWTYAAETPSDFFAPVISGAQRLPNGNTLIAYGRAGTIFQVTPDGRTVWKYTIPRHYHISLSQRLGAPSRLTYEIQDSDDAPPPIASAFKNAVYRAYWHPPNHPELQALDLAPGAYIEDYPDPLEWTRDALAAGDFGQPLARSRYHIYLDNNILIYFKQPCDNEDAQTKFFLHIIPARARDLPADRQEYGFDNLDFNFADNDVHASNDYCIALRDLPRYPIRRIHTGQFTHVGELWRADINLND